MVKTSGPKKYDDDDDDDNDDKGDDDDEKKDDDNDNDDVFFQQMSFFVEFYYLKLQYGDKKWFQASFPLFQGMVKVGLMTVKLVLNLSLHCT